MPSSGFEIRPLRGVADLSMSGQDSGDHGRARPTANSSTTSVPASSRPMRQRRGCGACPSPIWASPGSTITASCASGWARPCTRRGRPRSSAPSSSRELLSEPGSGPVLLTRAGPAQVTAAVAIVHDRWRGDSNGSPGDGRVAPGPGAPRAGGRDHGGDGRSSRRGRVRGRARAPTACTPPSWPTVASPGSIVCWPRSTSWPRRMPSSWSPAWRERWRASSEASARLPIVAVPVSTGYGAAFEGVTALLAMHASCAAGLTVVGIDNGFGAACAVARILP